MSSCFFARDNSEIRQVSYQWLLLLLIALLLPQSGIAMEARPVSPSVVLVLKLVSKTHVQPTTGIVIGEAGLVLVPAEFVQSEGEFIVLDGGTDIVKHGRPGKVVNQSASGTLAILSVNGLSRPTITLSEYTPEMQAALQLTAFPPAEFIAKGAPPLWNPVEMAHGDFEGQFVISESTPQPYVTGAIFDSCGFLAGINITTGQQSFEPGNTPATIFAKDLGRILEAMQISLPLASCEDYSRIPTPVAETQAAGNQQQPATGSDPNLIGPEVYRPFIKRKRLNPFQGAAIPSRQVENTEPPSIWLSIPLWLPLLALVILAALIWKLVFFFRIRKADSGKTENSKKPAGIQPASAEPDTAPLFGAAGNQPRSAPLQLAELPDMDQLPDNCDAVLVVDVSIDADTRFKRFCAVNSAAIDIVLGRGDADISIDHPVVSRVHARLVKQDAVMTISDQGSSSGTYIRGVPCLPGEILYVESDDEIFLGDVQLHISMIRKEVTPV